MNKIKFFFALFLLSAPLSATYLNPQDFFVHAADKDNKISITAPWASVSKARNGAVYMNITSPTDVKLIKAEAPLTSQSVQIHTHVVDAKGVARMREIRHLICPAGQTIVLKPMSNHIMLMGLKRKLAVGQQVDLKLTFQDNTGKKMDMHVTVPVKQIRKKCSSCKA